MTELSDLTATISLVDQIEYFLPDSGRSNANLTESTFTDVSMYKRLRITIRPSTIIKVNLEWSCDGQRVGPSISFRCASETWKSEMFEVILPYLRIHIVNESGKPCEELFIHTWYPCVKSKQLRWGPGSMYTAPAPEAPKPPQEVKEASRGRSPFSVLMRPKASKDGLATPKSGLATSSLDQRLPLKDHRLPDFIPQGALLVGGDKGKIVAIPKGNVGEYLMMGEWGPTYMLPYPPVRLSETSASLLKDQDL